MSNLRKKYRETVAGTLKEKFSLSNPMMIPRLDKIVLSMGIAEATKDKNIIQDAQKELALISGQRPKVTSAKISISNFKLREGQAIGLMVTLRGTRMYDFLERFIHIASPRIRDFRGFKGGCDGRGNYSVGIESHEIFPELNLDQVKRTQGMNITFVTSATENDHCLELLRGLGMPIVEGVK